MSELATQEAGVSIDEQIGQALKRMPVTDAKIKALTAEYQALKTNGVDDKESYNAVYSALSTVIKVRTSIEASRKILKADALKFGKAVDTEANRLTEMVLPIEDHLYKQRMAVDNEIARIKAVKDAEEQERYQGRAFKLAQLGMSFDGNIYKRGDIIIPAILLKTMDDSKFAGELAKVKADYDLEQNRIAEDARLKKEEEDRLASEKLAQDTLKEEENKRLVAEKERLEAIAKEQAKKEAAIKAAQDKIDAEKKAIEDQKRKEEEEKRHAEEIAKAKVEAAEQARKDEQARVERETKEREERDRLAAIEAEEKKAQMTDKEKLKDLLAALGQIDIPEFKSKKAKATGLRIEHLLKEVCDFINEAL